MATLVFHSTEGQNLECRLFLASAPLGPPAHVLSPIESPDRPGAYSAELNVANWFLFDLVDLDDAGVNPKRADSWIHVRSISGTYIACDPRDIPSVGGCCDDSN